MKTETVNKKSPSAAEGPLKGWTEIARGLGTPVTTAHRWSTEWMPGPGWRRDRDAVSARVGRESRMPKPAHAMTEDAEMAAALKESIAAARKGK